MYSNWRVYLCFDCTDNLQPKNSFEIFVSPLPLASEQTAKNPSGERNLNDGRTPIVSRPMKTLRSATSNRTNEKTPSKCWAANSAPPWLYKCKIDSPSHSVRYWNPNSFCVWNINLFLSRNILSGNSVYTLGIRQPQLTLNWAEGWNIEVTPCLSQPPTFHISANLDVSGHFQELSRSRFHFGGVALQNLNCTQLVHHNSTTGMWFLPICNCKFLHCNTAISEAEIEFS